MYIQVYLEEDDIGVYYNAEKIISIGAFKSGDKEKYVMFVDGVEGALLVTRRTYESILRYIDKEGIWM